MTNYFIIDKNNCVIQDIQHVLNEFNNANCVGNSIEKPEILNCIINKNVKLVFINIDCFYENLFVLISEIDRINITSPKYIAISSNKENAYEALKLGFYDFLLLPLNKIEIQKSILRLENLNSLADKTNICIKSYKDFQYLEFDSIVYLKADNNTTDFFLKNNSSVSAYKTLKTFEKALPANFIRIHRSYMINIKFITRIQYGKNTCTVNYLNQEIPFSKTYLENIDKIMRFLTDKSVEQ